MYHRPRRVTRKASASSTTTARRVDALISLSPAFSCGRMNSSSLTSRNPRRDTSSVSLSFCASPPSSKTSTSPSRVVGFGPIYLKREYLKRHRRHRHGEAPPGSGAPGRPRRGVESWIRSARSRRTPRWVAGGRCRCRGTNGTDGLQRAWAPFAARSPRRIFRRIFGGNVGESPPKTKTRA